jgi:hypothetical protein
VEDAARLQVAEKTSFGHDAPEDDGGEEGEDDEGVSEPLPLGGVERAKVAVGLLGPGVRAETRDDELLGDPRPGRSDQERGDGEEVVVRGGADGVRGIDDVRGLLREAGEERVDRPEDEVRAVAARDPGERRGEAGERVPPAARKITAASGMRRTYPTSLAAFERIPANTTTNVRSFRGAERTRRRRSVPMRPLPSATPIPSRATRTVPSGAKLVKFETVFSRTRCIPSTVNRLTTVIAFPVPGWTAVNPAQEPIAEAARTASARRRKIVAG